MMYSNKNFIKDFVKRTKENYENLSNGPFEVTQLINSAVGLLIIPEQKIYTKIVDSMVSDELTHKLLSGVKKYTYNNPLNLQQIARHLRNSISHGKMTFNYKPSIQCSSMLIISSINFKDENIKNGKIIEELEIEISVDVLKDFFFAFSESASKI